MNQWAEGRKKGMTEKECYKALADFFSNNVYDWSEQDFWEIRAGEAEEIPHPDFEQFLKQRGST